MSIDTVNEKRALMMLGLPWSNIPISSDGLDQADNQQLLWEYPGLLWSVITEPEIVEVTGLLIKEVLLLGTFCKTITLTGSLIKEIVLIGQLRKE